MLVAEVEEDVLLELVFVDDEDVFLELVVE